jgi:hypothetical protein
MGQNHLSDRSAGWRVHRVTVWAIMKKGAAAGRSPKTSTPSVDSKHQSFFYTAGTSAAAAATTPTSTPSAAASNALTQTTALSATPPAANGNGSGSGSSSGASRAASILGPDDKWLTDPSVGTPSIRFVIAMRRCTAGLMWHVLLCFVLHLRSLADGFRVLYDREVAIEVRRHKPAAASNPSASSTASAPSASAPSSSSSAAEGELVRMAVKVLVFGESALEAVRIEFTTEEDLFFHWYTNQPSLCGAVLSVVLIDRSFWIVSGVGITHSMMWVWFIPCLDLFCICTALSGVTLCLLLFFCVSGFRELQSRQKLKITFAEYPQMLTALFNRIINAPHE